MSLAEWIIRLISEELLMVGAILAMALYLFRFFKGILVSNRWFLLVYALTAGALFMQYVAIHLADYPFTDEIRASSRVTVVLVIYTWLSSSIYALKVHYRITRQRLWEVAACLLRL